MQDSARTQVEVLTALSNPAMYGGDTVRRIDTHASTVFLAGARAIKIKRAVTFPFLDYSTLDRRKAACEAEIAVNQPYAPEIYQGIVAITRQSDGAFRIGGNGIPVEWAVYMHRFDENVTLDNLADRNLIDDKLADNLARTVAVAHDKAPVAEVEPWLAAFKLYIAQNDAAFQSDPSLFPLDDVDRLKASSLKIYELNYPLLVKRGADGFVRRLHGDLHLGNIVLLRDRPVLFDAVEFDPLVATGDVLYDLAFLIMDLIERGLRPAANIVLNRYLQESVHLSHFDALAALPLFLSMRAAIRAKVTAARRDGATATDRSGIERAAQRYFGLALEFLNPPQAILLAIGGLSGTGKSVLARAIAPALGAAPGAVMLRSDVERKHQFGVNETARLPKEGYSSDATKRVYSSLAENAGRIISAGHSAVVDAVYADADERSEIARVATDRAITFRGIFLTADLKTRLSRVGRRAGDASDADQSVVREQSLYKIGQLDWNIVDATGSPQDTLAIVKTTIYP